MTKSVEIQLEQIFDEVSKNVKGVVETKSKELAKETAQKLRSSSPRGRSGSYANGWKAAKQRDGSYIVHNATDYQLTHLLENSHVIRNASGEYGRTSPGHGQIIHIKPVEEWANAEFQNRITEELEKL